MTSPADLIMVPRPREMRLTGGGPPLSCEVTEQLAPQLPAQGFAIEFAAGQITVRYADTAGQTYAQGLLQQIRSQVSESWPRGTIVDSPDYPVRGYLLDVSRGRVPTRATLQRIVELMSLLRLNHLQLYTEHTFAYAEHQAVWRDASPITAEEVRWLDALCQENGIELAANQNTFGHMENWFQAGPQYLQRAELPDGFELGGLRRPPMTLAPTCANADFVAALLAELLPNFTSKKINIGGDETYEIGRGASAAAAAEVGEGRVYLDHLRRILDPLIAAGYEPQFWGDIMVNHPELIGELPAGAIALAWEYEPPWPASDRAAMHAAAPQDYQSLDDPRFAGMISRAVPFSEAGYPYWVAPSTLGFQSLIGRVGVAYENLLDTSVVGLAHGASGYLITDWGDHGHLQPPSISFPPLVYGAGVSWAAAANRDLEVAPILDAFVFADPARKLGDALERLGRAHTKTGLRAFHCSPLALALIGQEKVMAGNPDPAGLASVLDDLDTALADLAAAQPEVADGGTVVRELTAAARFARIAGLRMLRDATGSGPSDDELEVEFAAANKLHEAAWAERSRPGGIERGRRWLQRWRTGPQGEYLG